MIAISNPGQFERISPLSPFRRIVVLAFQNQLSSIKSALLSNRNTNVLATTALQIMAKPVPTQTPTYYAHQTIYRIEFSKFNELDKNLN